MILTTFRSQGQKTEPRLLQTEGVSRTGEILGAQKTDLFSSIKKLNSSVSTSLLTVPLGWERDPYLIVKVI